MTHLCVYPPDFGGELNSCFDDKGSVGVHGHTRLPLDNKCTAIRQAHHRKCHWSVPVSFVLMSNTWVYDFKPLHKVAKQVNDFLLQSRAVLNNWISFVRDLLLKLLQFLDLLSYLQLWLSQRGDPERQRLRRSDRKRWDWKAGLFVNRLRTMSLSGLGRCSVVLRCKRSAVSSSSRPVLHLSDSSAQSPWQTAALPSQSLFAAKQRANFWHICKCYEKVTGHWFQDCRNQLYFVSCGHLG